MMYECIKTKEKEERFLIKREKDTGESLGVTALMFNNIFNKINGTN